MTALMRLTDPSAPQTWIHSSSSGTPCIVARARSRSRLQKPPSGERPHWGRAQMCRPGGQTHSWATPSYCGSTEAGPSWNLTFSAQRGDDFGFHGMILVLSRNYPDFQLRFLIPDQGDLNGILFINQRINRVNRSLPG